MVNSTMQAPFLQSSLFQPSYSRTISFRTVNKLRFPLIFLGSRPNSSNPEVAPLIFSSRSYTSMSEVANTAPLVLSSRAYSKLEAANAVLPICNFRPYSSKPTHPELTNDSKHTDLKGANGINATFDGECLNILSQIANMLSI